MAIVWRSCMCRLFFCRLAISSSYSSIERFSDRAGNRSKSGAVFVDIMDEFTSKLMQRKVDKWSVKSATAIIKEDKTTYESNCKGIEQLNDYAIDSCIQEAINFGDNSNVLELMKQCIKYKKCPSLSNLNYILQLCSQCGDKDMINQIKQLCKDIHPEFLPPNSNFDHYLAVSLWMRGNITEALVLFEETYNQNPFLRRRIRLILKYLVNETVSKLSEAVLIKLVRFAELLVKNYSDYYLLTCIWETCFLSEWFADQELSISLLQQHVNLCKAITSRVPHVVSISLRAHRIDIVYRLLETLLANEMMEECNSVLLSLFDYQVRMGDIKRCSEIIRWSLANNVEIPPVCNENFLKLLISGQPDNGMLQKFEVPNKPKVIPHFKF